MSKPKIRIVDNQFAHGTSLGSGDLKIFPRYFDWYRGPDNINDIVVVTEDSFHLLDHLSEKIKIGWLLEPHSVNPKGYSFVIENRHRFNYILTHNRALLHVDPAKFVLYQFGGCWILPEQRGIKPKTKNISIIASDKRDTDGHKLRHHIIERYANRFGIDVFGRGYTPVENKYEALAPYRYSIVIENENSEDWFTEKLIDCFTVGTIPIYWGTRNIYKYFNNSGIMEFNSAEHLQGVFEYATKFTYDQSLSFVKENYNTVSDGNYDIPEDRLWKLFFSRLLI